MSPAELEAKIAMLPHQTIIKKLDAALELAVGERVGIAMMIYPLNVPGSTVWICNSRREDIATVMRGLLAKWESEGSIPAPSEQ